MERMKL